MGGLIILLGILLPTFLLCELNNIYVIVMILTSLWMGVIGFLDDYIKVFKKQKKGLAGKFKLFGQVFLGCLVSLIFYFHSDVTVQEKKFPKKSHTSLIKYDTQNEFIINEIFEDEKKSTNTSIPFLKIINLIILQFCIFLELQKWSWLVYLLIVVSIISAVSRLNL